MAALQSSLFDREFENWVKAGLALQFTEQGIENFVEDIVHDLHQYILGLLTVQCCNCTNQNIIKCEQNSNFCQFDNLGRCLYHNLPCPVGVCDIIRDEILRYHRYGKPFWKNTDVSQWCTNKWKIAVCYMLDGYSDKTSAKDIDLSGLLNLVINYAYSQNYVADDLSTNTSIFRKARVSRNGILHTPRQRLTDVKLRAYVATFKAVLSDANTLSTDKNAIAAIDKLEQILNNTISITTQHAEQILAKALHAVKEAGQEEVNNLKVEKEIIYESILERLQLVEKKIRDNLKNTNDENEREYLKRITKLQEKTLNAIKDKSGEIKKQTLEQIAKEKENYVVALNEKSGEIKKQTLEQIAKEKENYVVAFKEESGEIKKQTLEQIAVESKQITIEHSEALIEKKNELIAEINMTNTETKERQYLSSITELRQDLVSLYQKEARYLTDTIYPLIQRRNINIEDLYVPPSMHTVDKETMKPGKTVVSIEDIFGDNSKTSKNIYVVGDAGMGKSALCKKIVSDWCKSKSEIQTADTLTTDQKYMQTFAFVFFISLRYCNTDLNIIDMIKHQIFDELDELYENILMSLLRNEKCFIVLDGLDEWTPKVKQTTAYSSYSPVMIPGRKGVRNCSILTTTRPWKLEAVRLESSHIDKQIELLGIEELSYEKFIKHMITQMDPNIDIKVFCDAFLKEVRTKQLETFLSIPIILKLLICIFHAYNRLRETKCSNYSKMFNLLFEIAKQRIEYNANCKNEIPASNVQLPKCFAEDKDCAEFGSLLCPLSKVAFETLLSETPESSLVFEISTTEIHDLTNEQLIICLNIGILSKTKNFSKQNYAEEHTKISFLHKTFQEFLAALWISLETNKDTKETNIKKFKTKCNTITSMFELSQFLIFVSGMNSKIACELSEHTREITTQSDIIREFRQSTDPNDQSQYEVKRVQKLTISCINEGWVCQHSDRHWYLEDIFIGGPFGRDKDRAATHSLITINKNNIRSINVKSVSLKPQYNILLEVSGLEKLIMEDVLNDEITIEHLLCEHLVNQSSTTISTLMLNRSYFQDVTILQSTRCLTRLHLEHIELLHENIICLMDYLSKTHRLKEIGLGNVECEDCCDYDECSHVLDLSQHEQLESLNLWIIKVALNTEVNVTNMVKCVLGSIKPVMSFVQVTKSLQKSSRLKYLEYFGFETHDEEAAVIVETISSLTHIEHIRLEGIDFFRNELVLSPDCTNIYYVDMHLVTMTKRSCCGLIDSILACNQAVYVSIDYMHIKSKEDIQDILENVRQSSLCQVMNDKNHKEGEIDTFYFKTIPRQ